MYIGEGSSIQPILMAYNS